MVVSPKEVAPILSSIADPLFLSDLGHAFFMRRTSLCAVERASGTEILTVQRQRLAYLLEHAARHSRFYGRRWRGRVPYLLPERSPTEWLG